MGQEIGVTPLLIVSMISAVANGGILYRPYVVKKVQDSQKGTITETESHGERVISQETARQLQDMLEVVVTDGTARGSKLDGYRAAGKTGTAQKIDETGRYAAHKYVASFVGYAPASNPSLSLIVVVDEPAGEYYGAQVAAPIFKNIAEQILRYRSVAPDMPSYAPAYTFQGEDTKEARSRKPEARIENATLASVGEPHSGFWLLASGSLPDGPHELGDIAIPDFYGKSLRDVTEECLKAGLRLQSIGSGAAVEQLPPPGAGVRAGSRVRVRFSTRLSQR
jgi:membrane peptidoglycan carboxypeptidase